MPQEDKKAVDPPLKFLTFNPILMKHIRHSADWRLK